MAYDTAQARQDVLDRVGEAIELMGLALAALGEAYEQLDEYNADRLEDELFRPIQVAYGRAIRTHAEFAERHRLPSRSFAPASPGLPSPGVKAFLASATSAIGEADGTLARLQDSMLPVEVGDAELRSGLSEVRRLIGDLSGPAREFVRTLGR